MYSSTGSKSSFHLREAVAYLEKENALLRNNLMECSAAKEKLQANLLEKETTLQNALTQLSVSKANLQSLREQLKSESIIADKSTKSMIESMQEKSKYSAQQVMSLESTLNTLRVELHKERTARNIEVGNLRDQLRETKDSLLVTEGTVSDLQKIIKGLRSQNELTDSPSLRAYIRDTAVRHQPTSIPRPNSQNSKKLSEKASTEPIKLAQPTSQRYHTSLSAARIRARSLSPTSSSARKAIKSPYTYTSGFSRSSKTKSSSSSSGGYYLLDSEPTQSEHVTHSFNNTAISDTNDPARSKSLDDFEVVSTISLQDQLLSQHTDKEDTSGAGVQQQSGASKNTHELRGQFTQTSPSQVVEKVTTPGNISSVTAASSSVVDTYFRSMNFSTDDQHNSIHHSGKSPLTNASTSPPSSASSTIENRARSPKASRALHIFSASESSSLDSYGVDNHPNLQPESKARSNSPKRSASQEFVDSVYGTPEKRRVKTENNNTSGSTSVRQSKPMTFPPSISPSRSFSRSQSTSAEEATSTATQSLLCFSPKKRLTELDIGADVYMYRTNSFQSIDKHATTVIMHTLDRYNSLVDEYNRLFQSLPPEERQKHLLRESQVQQQQRNTPKRTDRSNPNPFQEELLSINEQLLTENSKLTKDLNEVRAMISTQLHKMKNENLTLLLQIHEQGEKLTVYDNLTRINIGPGIPEDDGVSEVLTKLKEVRHSDRHSEWLMMDFKAAEKIVRYFDSVSQNMHAKRDAKIFSDLQQQVVLPYGESVRGINNLKPSINPSDQYHNPSGNMLSLAVSGESKIANTTSFHQSLGDLKNRCDSLQQELTSYGPAPSLSVAMAEKRVLECKLQETVTGFERNTALLEGQYLTAVSELRAFLKLEKSEKVNLQSKLAEQSQTISQLTHHLKQLQCRTAALT
eukprot:gene29323-38402_t